MNLALILFIGGLFRFVIGVIWLILIVIALLDLFKSNLPTNTKLLWLIVILIAPGVGSLIYLLWGKYQKLT